MKKLGFSSQGPAAGVFFPRPGRHEDDYSAAVVVVDPSECPELEPHEDVYTKIVSNLERHIARRITADLIEDSIAWEEELLSRPPEPKKPKKRRPKPYRPPPVAYYEPRARPWRYSLELRMEGEVLHPQYHVGPKQLRNTPLFVQIFAHEEMMNLETRERGDE